MANQGLSKALKATMGRALRETGIALKEASGMEVSWEVTVSVLHSTGIVRTEAPDDDRSYFAGVSVALYALYCITSNLTLYTRRYSLGTDLS